MAETEEKRPHKGNPWVRGTESPWLPTERAEYITYLLKSRERILILSSANRYYLQYACVQIKIANRLALNHGLAGCWT